MKYRYKVLSVSPYDVKSIEAWLENQAKNGLILEKFSNIVKFKKDEPQNLRYRLEPINNQEDEIPQDMEEIFEDFGWEYVCKSSKLYYIFKGDSQSSEPHTDPYLQSQTYDNLSKRLKWAFIIVLLSTAVIFAMLFGGIFADKTPIYNILINRNPVTPILLFLLYPLLIFSSIKEYRTIKKLQNSLKNGVFPPPTPVKSSSTISNVMSVIILPIIIISLYGLSFYGINQDWYLATEEVKEPLPIVKLADIYGESPNIVKKEKFYENFDYGNFTEHDWSILLNNHYKITESAIAKGEMWTDLSGEYSPSIYITYYDLIFDFMGKQLSKELEQRNITKFQRPPLEYFESQYFDEISVSTEDSSQILIAYKENKVLLVKYYGKGDLSKSLTLFEDAVKKLD